MPSPRGVGACLTLVVLALASRLWAQPEPPPDAREAAGGRTPMASADRPWHEGLLDPAVIYIEPLVLTDSRHQQLIRDAAFDVAELYDAPVAVRLPEPPRPDLPNALGAPFELGDSLAFPPVAAALTYVWRRDPGLPDALAVVAVAGAPIGFPARDGRFLEGPTWSVRAQGVAAVSLPLLLDEAGAQPLPDDAARSRIAKALARMVGQALGLADSATPDSVMYRPPSPRDLDGVPLALSRSQETEWRVLRVLCALADGRANVDLEAQLRDRAAEGDVDAAAALAVLLERRDARDQARPVLARALEATPDVPRLHLSAARLAFRDEDYAAAADAWDRVLALHPHAPVWAGTASPDWLLTHQGLPNREDGAAGLVWRDPLERAQAALEAGQSALAAEAAEEALARARDTAALNDRALFDAPAHRGRSMREPSRVGLAAGVLAVALTRQGEWERAARALDQAREQLDPAHLEQLEHVQARIVAGLGGEWEWRSPAHDAPADRFWIGLRAFQQDDAVAALDAWAPLLDYLDTEWAPNVPVNELADLYLKQGDNHRARDVLLRAQETDALDPEGRDRLALTAQPDDVPVPAHWMGRIRRYSVRQFVPAIAVAAGKLMIGTSDGLITFRTGAREVELETVVQGLPAGRITAVATVDDRQWLGTTQGLFHREGAAEWTEVRQPSGAPMPVVRALASDGGTSMLVGTDAGVARVTGAGDVFWEEELPRGRVAGLMRADDTVAVSFERVGPAVRKHGVWQRIGAPTPAGPYTRFGMVALDAFNRVTLLQTQREGTAICRETPFAVYCDDLPAGATPIGPVASRDGRLWLAAGRELAQWDHAVGWMPAGVLPDDADAERIIAIAPDGDRGLWALTGPELYHVADARLERELEFRHRALWREVLADPRGGAWRVHENQLEHPEGVVGPEALPPGSGPPARGAVLVDERGIVWTVAGGLLYHAPAAAWVMLAPLPADVPSLRLEAVADGTLWAADGATVWSWNAERGWERLAPPAGLAGDDRALRGIACTADGRVWIAWADRLAVREPGGDWTESAAVPRRGLVAISSRGDALWIATRHDGVYRVAGDTQHWTPATGLPGLWLSDIRAVDDGAWITLHHGGAARWDGHAWRVYHAGDLPAPLVVDAVVPLRDGGVWFQVGDTWYEHRPAAEVLTPPASR